MTDDISDTIVPKSDQLDAVDLLSGPRTFTITEVTRGNADQPVNIRLAEFPRVWRPSKGMRRVLVGCWGKHTGIYAGRKVRLYCDPSVKFGGIEVGGIRISHLSHIGETKKIPQIVSKGKGGIHVVEPIESLTPEEQVADLRAEWHDADPERRKAIEAEVQQLTGGAR